MYSALAAEERNKPTVTLVNLGFANDAMSAASSRGMPGTRIVATSVPCEGSVIEEIEAGIDWLLTSNGPCFLEVATDPEENVFPMVPPGIAVSEMWLEKK